MINEKKQQCFEKALMSNVLTSELCEEEFHSSECDKRFPFG